VGLAGRDPMSFKKISVILGSAVLLSAAIIFGAGASELTNIGTVTHVSWPAYGTPPGSFKRAKKISQKVLRNELLETVENGSIVVELADDTVLTLGGSSSLVIDDFVYDPGSASGNANYDLMVGSFRFVSGHMPKENVLINTPSATIGIRGTDILISIDRKGATRLGVISGRALITSRHDGSERMVVPGTSAKIGNSGPISSLKTGVTLTGDDTLDNDIPEHMQRDPEDAEEDAEQDKNFLQRVLQQVFKTPDNKEEDERRRGKEEDKKSDTFKIASNNEGEDMGSGGDSDGGDSGTGDSDGGGGGDSDGGGGGDSDGGGGGDSGGGGGGDSDGGGGGDSDGGGSDKDSGHDHDSDHGKDD